MSKRRLQRLRSQSAPILKEPKSQLHDLALAVLDGALIMLTDVLCIRKSSEIMKLVLTTPN